MSILPSELYREVLVRLPAETVVRHRLVCKTWLNIIDDSSFVKDHTNHQSYSSHTLIFQNLVTKYPFYTLSLDSLHFINAPQIINATEFITSDLPVDLSCACICNGLILNYHRYSDERFVIWNPLTKESREVKRHDPRNLTCGYGFGYDYDADDYKVVELVYFTLPEKVKRRCHTHVYSLKSDSWKRIEDFPISILASYYAGGSTFFNGSLYWKTFDENTYNLTALDLATESFFQVPLPPVSSTQYAKLDALDGCLIFNLTYSDRPTFDAWVMKDTPGVDKSWIKLCSLQYDPLKVSQFRLVAYLKEKEQIVVQCLTLFMWFDIRTNFVKKFSIHGLQNGPSRIYLGNLVRLNIRDGAIGSRKREEVGRSVRLKVCVRDVGEMCCSDKGCCSAERCLLCKLETE